MNEHNAQITTAAAASEPKIVSQRSGALHTFTLSRPGVLNAFDDEMGAVLRAEIPRIARNPDLYIVGLLSSSPKAFWPAAMCWR